ncbi:basic amino acid ABC transporter substrate-binding protein [Butyrivibrio proteoclasticus]|uniref:basic amino acid ABC transporter substrate-binding protein n=1 Tax=Butyrivibrio proteoclasticus TaxID=43305 RepID=UPI00047A1F5C|nr:basic amino acid ABC transporter substrate-binding protein [Butyrivibrio proteoclasticus]
MKKKLFAAALATIMTVSLVTGCGKSTDTSSQTSEDTNQTASADKLVVGTNAEFPPFEYLGDDGEPDGFDIALIKAIGEKIGMEVEIQNMEFASLVTSIGSKIDVAIAGMTVTDERKETVDFSDPYYEAVQCIIVPEGTVFASADDLKGLKIGVQLGTTGEFIAEDIEGAEVSTYNKAVDAVNDLNNGRVDCVIIDANPASVFEAQFPDKVDVLQGTAYGFEVENYAIALPKGDTELANKINAALKELKEDGTYNKLVAQYIEN